MEITFHAFVIAINFKRVKRPNGRVLVLGFYLNIKRPNAAVPLYSLLVVKSKFFVNDIY
jgi:hypothetical protein